MSSTVYYLEMKSEDELCGSEVPPGLELREVKDAKVNARYYREVGGAWEWKDRLVWSAEEWERWVSREELMTWVAFYQGKEAGYVEMEKQKCGSVEVIYFGLLPVMIGKGLGGGMLTLAVERAWGIAGVERVWLHTCSEDHANALANYERRGFRLFKTEVESS